MKKVYKMADNFLSLVKRNKISLLILIFLLFVFIKAPSYKYETNNRKIEENPKQTVAINRTSLKTSSNSVSNTSFQLTGSDKKIVKSSNLEIELKKSEEAAKEVRTMVKNYKGYIENFYSYSDNDNRTTYTFSIKIPADKFYEAIRNFKKMGRVTIENYNSYDVTEKYSDIENKLKNLIVRRDRLRKLMEVDTKDLKDIISVDRELSKVQNQIENLVRRKRNMEESINYSSLRLTLKEKVKIKDISKDDWNLSNSINFYINLLINFCQWLFDKIIFITVFIPVWASVFIGYFIIKKISIIKNRRKY